MRVTIQLSSENRITFFGFDNGPLNVVALINGFADSFGDCEPQIIEKKGLSKTEKLKLKKLMSQLKDIYQTKQKQLKLPF